MKERRAGVIEERTAGAASRADSLLASPDAPWSPCRF